MHVSAGVTVIRMENVQPVSGCEVCSEQKMYHLKAEGARFLKEMEILLNKRRQAPVGDLGTFGFISE